MSKYGHFWLFSLEIWLILPKNFKKPLYILHGISFLSSGCKKSPKEKTLPATPLGDPNVDICKKKWKNRNRVKNIKVLTKRKEIIKIEWKISKILAKRKEKIKFEWQILRVLIHCTWFLKTLSLHIATVVKSHKKSNFATSNKKCLKNILQFHSALYPKTRYVTLPLHFFPPSFPENYNVSCLWNFFNSKSLFGFLQHCPMYMTPKSVPETVIAIFLANCVSCFRREWC